MHDLPHPEYEVKINGEVFKFHEKEPTGAQILCRVDKRPCAFELIAEYHHKENLVIEPTEKVDLAAHGLKGFITAHKEVVTIELNNKPYQVDRGEYTVGALLALIDETIEGYELYEEKNGPPMPLPDDKKVHIHGCEVFISQIRRGKSS